LKWFYGRIEVLKRTQAARRPPGRDIT